MMAKHRLTADKRKIRDFPKLPLVTSFIRQTLGVMTDITKSYFTIRKQVYECMMKEIIA